MTLLLSLIIGYILVYFLHSSIKKYPVNYYLGALFIGLFILMAPRLIGVELINQRYLGVTCFILIMLGGVMNKEKEYAQAVLSIRGELAIMGFIFISFHAWKHLLSATSYPIVWIVGLMTYLLLLPLTVTSIKKIRSMMPPKRWKQLHLLSYVFYLSIFLHIYLASHPIDQIIYCVIFGLYVGLRFIKQWTVKPVSHT